MHFTKQLREALGDEFGDEPLPDEDEFGDVLTMLQLPHSVSEKVGNVLLKFGFESRTVSGRFITWEIHGVISDEMQLKIADKCLETLAEFFEFEVYDI